MTRMPLLGLTGLLTACAADPYGPGTLALMLPDGERYHGRFMPLASTRFPPGEPVTYTMGPYGTITDQQALLVGPRGAVIVCRVARAPADAAREIVCRTPDDQLVQAVEVPM